jgi:hypothetical protein
LAESRTEFELEDITAAGKLKIYEKSSQRKTVVQGIFITLGTTLVVIPNMAVEDLM